jgi:hypothetical protein
MFESSIGRNKVNAPNEAEHATDYGTRASKTESLVYRVLQTAKHRTVEIVERFLDAAIIAGDKSNLRWRAQNILDRIARHGEGAIPRNEFDLVCWSDLQVTTGMQAKAKSRYRSKPRVFRVCLGCEHRFLAKRANNSTCSSRCQRRVHRKVSVSDFVKMTLPEAA